MADLTRCLICGKEYHYCPNCSKTHGWMFYCDTREHYQIFQVIDQYASKNPVLTIKEAKAQLENIGITADTDVSDLRPKIVKYISEITNYKEPERKAKKSKLFDTE